MKKHSVLGFLFFLTLAVLGSPLNGNLAYAGPKGIEFLEQLETGLIELSKKIRPSVVSLSPYVPSTPTGRLQGSLERGRPTNAGAGVIIDGRLGYIVTNHHVVRNSQKILVNLFGGEEMVGHVVGTDEDTDLAVVRVDTDKPLPDAAFGDSGRLEVGQMAFAVGNPYGLNDTLTFGIISGLNRENINLSRYEDFIQTDASINPGNSGGPLFNVRGEIIGINTAIINYAQSIGFAIPSNIAETIVRQLIEYGEVHRGWLGVGIEPVSPELAREYQIEKDKGVLINSVFEGDPAHKAGLQVGDIILRIGGVPVDSPSRMIRVIGFISPGQLVDLDIIRKGKRRSISVRLAKQRKDREQLASLGPGGLPPLGFSVESAQDPHREPRGAVVKKVFPGTAAERRGLKSGDRIIAVNGETVPSGTVFQEIIKKIPTGGPVFILYFRDGEKFHLALVREN